MLQKSGITVTAELGLKKHRNQQNKRGRFTGVIEEYVIPPEQALIYLEDQKYLGEVVADVESQYDEPIYAINLKVGDYKVMITLDDL